LKGITAFYIGSVVSSGKTCTGLTWRGEGREGSNVHPIFFIPKFIQYRKLVFGVSVGERGECILRTGSNEISTSF
jgi:hypothetical protein